MPAVTIRNLSDETHRALKLRAAGNKRSAEAEIRAILDEAVRPRHRLMVGSTLSRMSRELGLTNSDVEALGEARATRPAEPLDLG